MLGELAICYLFLGGAGAGVIGVCSLLDLIWVKEPFGAAANVSSDSMKSVQRIIGCGFIAGFIAVVLGAACLILDLGRIDRVVTLFTNPTFSFLTVGSYSLVALMLCSAFLALVRFLYLPDIARLVVIVTEVLAVVIAAIVMLYAGLLLQSFGTIAFWNSALVPLLFVLSSASSGIALLFVIALFGDLDGESFALLRRLVRFDAAIIVLEALAAVSLLLMALGSVHPAMATSVHQLIRGESALVWWLGFGVCGLLAPFVLELAAGHAGKDFQKCLALVALLILIGALCLRVSVVEVGMHREVVLEEVIGGPTGVSPLVLEDVELAITDSNLVLERVVDREKVS